MSLEEQLNYELQNSTKIQREMQSVIDELTVENTFLTETITTQKLGKIAIERRNLQSQMYIIQNEAKTKLDEAKKIRSRYENITAEAEKIKKSLSDKEENIDTYIQTEASAQVSEKLDELEKEKSKCKRLLDKHIRENDIKLKEQIDVYKQKRRNWIIILCISILISILSIYINFM